MTRAPLAGGGPGAPAAPPLRFPFRRVLATELSPQLVGCRDRRVPTRVLLPSTEPAWVVATHAGVRQVLKEASLAEATFAQGEAYETFVRVCPHLLSLDPPEHTRVRQLLSAAIPPRRAAALREAVAAVSRRLLSAMVHGKSQADLIAEYTSPLAAHSMALLLGLDFEVLQQARACFQQTRMSAKQGTAGQITDAWLWMSDRIDEYVQLKRRCPADDALTDLVALFDRDQRVTEAQFRALVFQLLANGPNTGTSTVISHGMVALLGHPEQFALLREAPDRLSNAACAEALRYCSPAETDHLRRTVAELPIEGVRLGPGHAVLASVAAANRDPEVFEHPDVFDLTRAQTQQIPFGRGPHLCPGSLLAKAQISIALRHLAEELPRLRLTVPVAELELQHGTSSSSVALKQLPVAW